VAEASEYKIRIKNHYISKFPAARSEFREESHRLVAGSFNFYASMYKLLKNSVFNAFKWI
jgi:hypothetical protein